MSSFGTPIAELFATLGLDDALFNTKLAAAQAKLTDAAVAMALPISKIDNQLDALGDNDGLVKLAEQFKALKAVGLSTQEALVVIAKDEARLETQNAALKAEFNRTEKAAIQDQLAARKVGVAERTALEKAADASRAAFQAEMLASQQAAYIEEQAAEVEAAKLGAATKVVILQQYLASVKAAYAEQLAAEEAMQTRRVFQQGAYAAGGYSAGRVAGLGGLVSTPVAVGVGAALSVYEIGKFTSQASEAAVATRNLGQELGITFEQARKLEETARITGVSINTFRQASGRLAEALNGVGAQGKTVMSALQELGVQGSTSGEVMLDFLNKLAGITDQTKRIELAREVFSRSSYELVALASNAQRVEEAFKHLGPVVGGESQKALTETGEAINQLGVQWDRLKQSMALTVGVPVVKFLNDVTQVAGLLKDVLHSNPFSAKSNAPGKSLNDSIKEEQDKANQDAAAQYRARHTPTLEEMRDQLNKAKATESTTGSALGRGVDALGPVEREQAQKDHDDAVALVADLQKKIKDMEYDTAEHRYALRSQDLENKLSHDLGELELERIKAEALAKIQKHEGDLTFDEIDKERDARLKANAAELTARKTNIEDRMALEKGRNGGLLDSKLEGELESAKKTAIGKDVMITADAEAEKASIRRKNNADEVAMQKHFNDQDEAFRRRENELNRERANDDLKARMEKEKGQADSNVKSMELIRENNKFQQTEGLITEQERIARDKVIDQLEYNTKKLALENEMVLLAQMEARDGELDVHAASRKQTLLNQLDALEEEKAKRSQGYKEEEIKGLDSIGQAIHKEVVARRDLSNLKDANDRLVQLENERIKTWALTQATQGLAIAYKQFISIAVGGVQTFNKEMSSAIIGSKSFHDAWQATIKSVGQAMVEYILNTIEKMAAAWIIQQIGISAASKIVAINQLIDFAALSGAAAFEATAAIPIVGPELAPAAGQLAQDTVLSTFLPPIVGHAEMGGVIPREGTFLMHADEYVINRPLTKALTSMAQGGGMGGGGDYLDFRGATFHGTTQGAVDSTMRNALAKLRRSGGGLSIRTGKM